MRLGFFHDVFMNAAFFFGMVRLIRIDFEITD